MLSTGRVSSGRLVGTFLGVCALTVLCGLVVVAVSRLLLQKRLRAPGGAAGDGGHHCSGKVSLQTSHRSSRALKSNKETFSFKDTYADKPLKQGGRNQRVKRYSCWFHFLLTPSSRSTVSRYLTLLWHTAPLRSRGSWKIQEECLIRRCASPLHNLFKQLITRIQTDFFFYFDFIL